MNARLSSATSLIAHLALLAMLSLITWRSRSVVPPPAGMEIEIVEFEHAMPLPDPSPPQADEARTETVLQPSRLAYASSTLPDRSQASAPISEPPPHPAATVSKAVAAVPALPIERIVPKMEIAPELGPAPVKPLPPVLRSEVPSAVSQVSAVPSSPATSMPIVPTPAPRRLDATALSRSLAAKAGHAPRSRLNSAAIGSAIGQAVPKGVAGLTVRQRANLVEMIRSQITPCWNPPIAEENSGRVSVMVRISLNRAGAVTGTPQVSRVRGRTASNGAYVNALAGSVRRAVLRCSPLRLPSELYEAWASVELNFDPRDVS